MSEWDPLEEELARWSALGREATLWWRDDDAGDVTPALETLIELSGDAGIGVALAVIPSRAQPALAGRIAAHRLIVPVQHGLAHENHEPPGNKACEFGDRRGENILKEELEAGKRRLEALFDDAPLSVFVPPWNRLGDTAVRLLPALGFRALSSYRPRGREERLPALREVNCHADVMDWKHTRGFIGTAKVVADIVEHLAARRRGAVDDGEPTGVLTHHLDHDPDCWEFMRELFRRTAAQPAASWLTPEQALCPA